MQFLWHDYETFGTRPPVDRPCQFAAQRTDADLKPLGDPVVIYCAPAGDVLPHPAACLITGITPQEAIRKGRVESEFAVEINHLMSEPGTCSAGFNSLRFDDEVTRHLLYRNLLDPYEREWKHGNSRWDLINLARMCYALRPDGLEWPTAEDAGEHEAADHSISGANPRPSFRLQDLAAANGIEHHDAHDALADVRATIDLASLIRRAQPKLFEWALSMRDKQTARKLLDPKRLTPVVHTSGRFSSRRGCTAVVLPLAHHPQNDKAVIVFDLMGDAESLAGSDSLSIRDRVFTPASDLPDDVARLPLKAVKWNAVPMLAPVSVLGGVDHDRIGLDMNRCQHNLTLLIDNIESIQRSVREAFSLDFEDAEVDPDLALYRGGFFDDADRRLMEAIHRCNPAELAGKEWAFRDPRLPTMLLRYRARNWPDTLSQTDWEAWQKDRRFRLMQPAGSDFFGFEAFEQELAVARKELSRDERSQAILDMLEAWGEELALDANISEL